MRKATFALLIAAVALGGACKKKNKDAGKTGSGAASASAGSNAGAGGTSGTAGGAGGNSGTTTGTGTNSGTTTAGSPTGPGQEGCLTKLDGNLPQGDLVLAEKCGPVTVEGEITIDAKLTIEPGVTVQFAENASLGLGYNATATLVAQGTADKPITFTSAGDKVAGWWKGIHLYNNAKRSTLDHVVIEDAGADGDESGYALRIDGEAKDITVTNSELRTGKGWGLWADGDHVFVKLEGNKFHDLSTAAIRISPENLPELGANDYADRAVELANGTVARSATLRAPGTYRVMGELYVERTAENAGMPVLTIEPGVTVELVSGAAIYVGYNKAGSLKAVGAADKPITFTGFDKSKGAWKGIVVYQNAKDVAIQHAVVEYGTSDAEHGVISFEGAGTGALEDVKFAHLDGVGLSVQADAKVTSKDLTVDDAPGAEFRPKTE